MSHFFTTEISNPVYEMDHLRMITVKSNALKKRVDITLYIPPNPHQVFPLDVVILLHGVYGSHWAWAFNGGAHRTAHRLINEGKMRPMVLVMPSDGLYGDGSGYLQHDHEDYEQWIADDVIEVVKEQITQVSDQSKFFITGLSMGGYGALRLGAKYPEVFTSFSGLSSITAFDQLALFLEHGKENALFDVVHHRENVLECMLNNQKKIPLFRFDCGTEDLLIDYNRQLHTTLDETHIPHIYVEHIGAHEWVYWRDHIEDSLLFFNRF